MIVVCASGRPRSAIISTKSRRLSLNRGYHRTHTMMTSRSKWRPSNNSSMLFSLLIADLQCVQLASVADGAGEICTRALAAVFRQRKRSVGTSWRVDETYVLVGGQWKYLYRAVDKLGQTVDFLLTAHRDEAAARRFWVDQRPLYRHGSTQDAAPLRLSEDARDGALRHAESSGDVGLLNPRLPKENHRHLLRWIQRCPCHDHRNLLSGYEYTCLHPNAYLCISGECIDEDRPEALNCHTKASRQLVPIAAGPPKGRQPWESPASTPRSFVPRSMLFERVPMLSGRAASLEVLGELVLSSTQERDLPNSGQLTYGKAWGILAALETPGLRRHA